MIEDVLFVFLAAGGVAFLIASATAPLEALNWWAGDPVLEPLDPGDGAAPSGQPPPSRFVVYMGGIDMPDGASLTGRERRFLDAVERELSDAVMVDTVFPYAVTGEPLVSGPGLFRWVWARLADEPEESRRPLLANLINARNFFQVLVSADRRYGPVFNRAIAALVLARLREAGWRRRAPARVTLIGYSGGAQMAAGAAELLSKVLDEPPDLISLGGVIDSPSGLLDLARVHHLVGGRDRVQRMGAIGFPGRWPSAVGSAWNTVRRDGRLRVHSMGAMRHRGPEGYLGEAHGCEARENWRVTLDRVVRILAAGGN
jgi:hypothetical protein